MGRKFKQLTSDERNLLQRGLNEGKGVRRLASELKRSPSTISREIRRGLVEQKTYDAVIAREWARSHRRRGARKLVPGSPLTATVEGLILGKAWSPEQIAGRLKVEHSEEPEQRVSHETIYQYIYAHPVGELKKQLVEALRQGRGKRKPRSRGKDRRGGIRNMRSIRERPAEAQAREVPGHWEGDLIKGAANGSAIGTLVDRATLFVILAKVDDSTAASVLDGFTRRLRTCPRKYAGHSPMTREERWLGTRNWKNAPTCGSTLPTPIALGSDLPTRTPTGCCFSTSPKSGGLGARSGSAKFVIHGIVCWRYETQINISSYSR